MLPEKRAAPKEQTSGGKGGNGKEEGTALVSGPKICQKAPRGRKKGEKSLGLGISRE